MTRSKATAAIAACAYFLSANAACVTVGKAFDTTHLEDVRVGVAREEVIAWFGEPSPGNKLSLVDTRDGCVKRYRYGFADDRESFVLWIDFDNHDRVCHAVYSGPPIEASAFEVTASIF